MVNDLKTNLKNTTTTTTNNNNNNKKKEERKILDNMLYSHIYIYLF